jgi:hypothetical protein
VRPISADVPRHRTLPLCVDYYLIVHCSQTAGCIAEEKDLCIASPSP